ncbi:MAG: hypothetical protein QM724_12225 [Flavobacteriales bacterium]
MIMQEGKEGTGSAQPQQDNTGNSPETGGIMVGPQEHTPPQAPMERPDEEEDDEEIGTD